MIDGILFFPALIGQLRVHIDKKNRETGDGGSQRSTEPLTFITIQKSRVNSGAEYKSIHNRE